MRLQTGRINKNSYLIKLVRKDLDANKGDLAIKKLQTNNLQLNEDTRNDKCDSAGARTLDPLIKSQLLYQLSYEIFLLGCKYSVPTSNTPIIFI